MSPAVRYALLALGVLLALGAIALAGYLVTKYGLDPDNAPPPAAKQSFWVTAGNTRSDPQMSLAAAQNIVAQAAAQKLDDTTVALATAAEVAAWVKAGHGPSTCVTGWVSGGDATKACSTTATAVSPPPPSAVAFLLIQTPSSTDAEETVQVLALAQQSVVSV